MTKYVEIPRPPMFLQVLQTQIEHHLSDPSLNVNRLTRLVGMSRTDLHRKLSQAVGMSATEYVRQIRLRHAAKLLIEEPEWSVFHVALEVGFNSQSYFTTRFKQLFGVTPGAYRKGYKKLEHV